MRQIKPCVTLHVTFSEMWLAKCCTVVCEMRYSILSISQNEMNQGRDKGEVGCECLLEKDGPCSFPQHPVMIEEKHTHMVSAYQVVATEYHHA